MGYYPAIASCHLVSRAWNCECRGKWPRRIILSRQNATRHLLQSRLHAPSELTNSVKELRIHSNSASGIMDICNLANIFPGVEVIQFACPNSSFHPRVDRFLTRILKGFSNLRVLQLHGLEFQSLKDFARLIHSTMAVEELTCSDVKFRAPTMSSSMTSLPVGLRLPRRILFKEINSEFFGDQVWLWAARRNPQTGNYEHAPAEHIFFGLNHDDAKVIRQFLMRSQFECRGTISWESSQLNECKRCERGAICSQLLAYVSLYSRDAESHSNPA